jgi:hypothetical protein
LFGRDERAASPPPGARLGEGVYVLGTGASGASETFAVMDGGLLPSRLLRRHYAVHSWWNTMLCTVGGTIRCVQLVQLCTAVCSWCSVVGGRLCSEPRACRQVMGAGYAVVIAAAAMTHRLPWPGYEQARLARGDTAIQCPSPLDVLKDAHGRSCY